MSVTGIELHCGQYGNEELDGTTLEFLVFDYRERLKKGWGSRPSCFKF